MFFIAIILNISQISLHLSAQGKVSWKRCHSSVGCLALKQKGRCVPVPAPVLILSHGDLVCLTTSAESCSSGLFFLPVYQAKSSHSIRRWLLENGSLLRCASWSWPSAAITGHLPEQFQLRAITQPLVPAVITCSPQHQRHIPTSVCSVACSALSSCTVLFKGCFLPTHTAIQTAGSWLLEELTNIISLFPQEIAKMSAPAGL